MVLFESHLKLPSGRVFHPLFIPKYQRSRSLNKHHSGQSKRIHKHSKKPTPNVAYRFDAIWGRLRPMTAGSVRTRHSDHPLGGFTFGGGNHHMIAVDQATRRESLDRAWTAAACWRVEVRSLLRTIQQAGSKKSGRAGCRSPRLRVMVVFEARARRPGK